MGLTAESLLIAVEATTDKAKENLRDVGAEGEGLGSKLLKAGAGIAIGMVATTAAIIGVASVLNDAVQAGEAEQGILAQMNSALKSTKDASGLSQQALEDLASSMSHVTTFSKEAYEQSEVMMLQFTHIGANVFPQAESAAANLSSRLGIDLTQSSRMVGMALNDPVNGLSRLTRFIGPVDAQTKALIKTYVAHGETAKAQGVILDILATKFGGASAAAAGTFQGQLQILGNRLEEVKADIGLKMLPVLTQLFEKLQPIIGAVLDLGGNGFGVLAGLVNDVVVPAISLLSNNIGGITGAVGGAAMVFKQITGFLKDYVYVLVQDIQPSISAVTNLFKGAKAPAIDFNDIFKLIGQTGDKIYPLIDAVGRTINTLVIGVIAFARREGPVFATTLRTLMGALQGLLEPLSNVWDAISKNIIPAIQFLIPIVLDIAGLIIDWGQKLAQFLVPIIAALAALLINVLAVAINVIAAVIRFLAPIVETLAVSLGQHLAPIINNVSSTVGKLFDWFQNHLLPVLIQLYTWFNDNIAPVLLKVSQLVGTGLLVVLEALGGYLLATVVPVLGQLAGLIGGAIGTAFQNFGNWINNVATFLGTMISLVQQALQYIGQLGQQIKALGQGAGSIPLVGGVLQGAGGVLSHFATGGTTTGSFFAAGETGAELITGPGMYWAPAGSHVYNPGQTASIMGSGKGSPQYHVHVYGTGLTAEAVIREQNWQAALHGGTL